MHACRTEKFEDWQMAAEQPEFSSFEWDETKRLSNLKKHGIDFSRAAALLMGPHFASRSDKNGEERILAVCPAAESLIIIIFTMRDEACRIISARAANKREQRKYQEIHSRRNSPDDR
jgi:uncharacterized DUF497 family protein